MRNETLIPVGDLEGFHIEDSDDGWEMYGIRGPEGAVTTVWFTNGQMTMGSYDYHYLAPPHDFCAKTEDCIALGDGRTCWSDGSSTLGQALADRYSNAGEQGQKELLDRLAGDYITTFLKTNATLGGNR